MTYTKSAYLITKAADIPEPTEREKRLAATLAFIEDTALSQYGFDLAEYVDRNLVALHDHKGHLTVVTRSKARTPEEFRALCRHAWTIANETADNVEFTSRKKGAALVA